MHDDEGVRPTLIHDLTPYAFEPLEAPYTDAGNRPHRRKAKKQK